MRTLLVAFLLAACATPPETGSAFDPVDFFAGETRGRGVLTMRDGSLDAQLRVESSGVVDQSGSLTLTQVIRMGTSEPRTRTWTMRPEEPGVWRGILTDARGPVTVRAQEGALTLSYAPKDIPLGRITQHLYLQPPGDTVINEGRISVMGITIRRMHEVIERGDQASHRNP